MGGCCKELKVMGWVGGWGGVYLKKGMGEGIKKGINGGDEFTSFVCRPGNLV